MTVRLRCHAVAAMIAVAVLMVPSALAAATTGTDRSHADGPRLELARDRVGVDKEVMVEGAGFDPGSLVTAVLCGNRGARGTPDCALGSTLEVGVQDGGTFSAPMRMVAPPAPCPCVVVASGATTSPVVMRVRLQGHRFRPGTAGRGSASMARSEVVVEEASLKNSSSFWTWFGAPAEAVLTLRVVNEGTAAGRSGARAGWGSAGELPIHFVSVPVMPFLEPREEATLEIPVRFDPLTNGDVIVAGDVRTGGVSVPFEDSLRIRPWGLFALAALLVMLPLMAALAWAARHDRRRRH